MESWKRTWRVVWLANLITAMGMMSFLPFFPSQLEEMGLSDPGTIAAWAGIIFGAAPLSATLMSPVWGKLGDRIGRKLMVVRAMLAISVFVGGMYFASTPWQLLALRIGQGLFSGFVPPSITLVSVAVPHEKQGRVTADLQTALPLGSIFGPMIGGLIAAAYGYREVFLFVGAAALISAVLIALFAEEKAGTREVSAERLTFKGFTAGLKQDLSDLWGNSILRSSVLLLFALQFGIGGTNAILEMYVEELAASDGAGMEAWIDRLSFLPGMNRGGERAFLALATSALFSGMAIANLVAMPIWGRYGDRIGAPRALQRAAIATSCALLLQASVPLYGSLFLGRIAMGAAMAGAGPLAFGIAAAYTRVDKRGGAFGLVFSARTLSVAMGGMIGGFLSSWIGINGLMYLSAGIVLIALVLLRGGLNAAQADSD